MVQSSAATVDEYLSELPDDRRKVAERIRQIARRTLPGFQERMAYGMPHYSLDESHGIAFASQRQYVSIYAGPKVLSAHKRLLSSILHGKGCVRFTRLDRINWALVESLFRAAAD